MLRTIIVRRALSLALLFTAGCLLAAAKDKEPAPRSNATTTTGEKFTNDSIKGKVVLLEFWTTWSADPVRQCCCRSGALGARHFAGSVLLFAETLQTGPPYAPIKNCISIHQDSLSVHFTSPQISLSCY